MKPADHQGSPPAPPNAKTRRGVVLIAVLVIVASLSLAGYQFSDMMTSEYKASENSHRMVQARRIADSGIHFAAAMLSSPDNYNNVLFGNPFNNEAFRDVAVQGDNKVLGQFSLIAPSSLDAGGGGGPFYGVIDESGKINPNAMMRLDPTGKDLHDVLMKLPNMTEDVANNIVAWMGGSFGIQNGGAQSDYYAGQTPPYRSKNGMLDSIDELMLVKGVTRDLLYGSDANRNGADDEGGQNGLDRGWAACLTVYSREQNRDVNGQPMVFLGNQDLVALAESLTLSDMPLREDMVKFILLYRKYGPASKTGGSQSLGSTLASALGLASDDSSILKEGDLSTYDASKLLTGSKKINSIFDLVGASVKIKTGTDPKTKKTIYTVYQSPLNDIGSQRELLPLLFNIATVTEDTDLAPRINVNTAPTAVLTALTALPASTPLDDTDITKITSARPAWGTAPDEIFQTPAWLVTEAQIDPKKLSALEKYITTRTQVYRVQSVGYFDGGKGPAVRVEAVIDTNNGRPRILAYRDLSELGRGLSVTPNP
jgi:type II secretory pathway component PulK